MEVIPLNFHKCATDEPGFFKAKESQVGFISFLMPQMYCLDDALKTELWGNFKVTAT